MNESPHREGEVARLEMEQEMLDTDSLEGADIIGILICVADADEMDLLEFLDTRLASDLIEISQSNPERSTAIIREWAELDRRIAEIN